MIPLFLKTKITRMAFFIFWDAVFVAASVLLAFFIRFDGQIPNQYTDIIIRMIILEMIFIIAIFYLQRLYHFTWAYVSADELISLVKATTISFIFLGVALYIYRNSALFRNFPRSTIFISYFLVLLLCGGIRFAKRAYLHTFPFRADGGEKTLIIGAGDAGEQILRNILSSKDSSYLPQGFIDDNPLKQGLTIHGVKVLGKINDIPKVVKIVGAVGMIIALPSASKETIKKAVEIGRSAGLQKIKIIPSLVEIIDSQISIRDLREVQIEDLLGRETIILETKAIEDFITAKSVLITGAAGSIGSELSRQAAKFKPLSLTLLDQDETGLFDIINDLKNRLPKLKINSFVADVIDEVKINQIFSRLKPNIVFHAAAYKHVPLMEKQPDEAIKNNVFGTKIVSEAALANGAEKFIFISTDKAVNPSSVMGATKRIGEMICQALNQKNNTKFISVRFGNVLNSRGSVIPAFKEQIKKGGPVKVTHEDMKRYFMLTSEAVFLVMQASAIGRGGEVFVLDMGRPVKIVDLAKEMIRLSGYEPDKDIPIVFTEPRPGEKFFEDILTAEEGTVATQNQKIFSAKLLPISVQTIEQGLKNLKDSLAQADSQQIKRVLKQIVPSYKAAE